MNESTTVRGSRARELPRPNRTYGDGRECAHEGCSTQVSRYNRSPYCWTHKPTTFPLVRGERRRRRAA